MKPKVKVTYKRPVYVKTMKAYEKEKERKKNERKRNTRIVICDSTEDVLFKFEDGSSE